jgi:hypothetical protein
MSSFYYWYIQGQVQEENPNWTIAFYLRLHSNALFKHNKWRRAFFFYQKVASIRRVEEKMRENGLTKCRVMREMIELFLKYWKLEDPISMAIFEEYSIYLIFLDNWVIKYLKNLLLNWIHFSFFWNPYPNKDQDATGNFLFQFH